MLKLISIPFYIEEDVLLFLRNAIFVKVFVVFRIQKQPTNENVIIVV